VFKVEGDCLYHNNKLIGPKDLLYVDYNELTGIPKGSYDGLKHITMPLRVDMVFVAGDKVVGIESKKANDLTSSVHQHRLARQIRTLIEEVDVPCLLVRGIPKKWRGLKTMNVFNEDMFEIWLELVRLQALGVYILPGPKEDLLVPKWLGYYRPALSGGRAALAAIKQSDVKPAKSKHKGWFLTNIKGIGERIATKLHTRFGSSRGALLADSDEWRELGIPKAIIDRKEDALK
jgi:ERCC4-type nuclease